MNKNQHRMAQGANVYHEKAQVYDAFCQAEDYPGLIVKFLKHRIKDKTILDLGCGTGKYSKLLCHLTQEYYALDFSKEQLSIAMTKVDQENIHFLQSSAQKIDLPDQSIDAVLATWFFGSILDLEIRTKALLEAERVLKKNGSVYVVENNDDCEFEQIIKRNPDISTTKEIQDWLLSNNFKIESVFETYFQFPSLESARNIFSEIWNEDAVQRISSSKIKHNIAIYEKMKK